MAKAVNVRISQARAFEPPNSEGDALIVATGLFTNSPDKTSQSSAFLRTPGIP
ncbi:MAG: hypothetical protein RMX97_25535 [Nostoc sp. DedQUE11]|nr:hypothetical protein [Nostoc sp. DedQUE11]